jgi:putative Holliday junction resolvase
MRPILSIDYGEKRIGLAISDELHLLAHPLKTIKNDKIVFEQILEIVKEYNVEKIIIGYPTWEKPTDIVKKIENFVKELKQFVKLDIEFVNEMYSTKIACEKLISLGKKYKKYKQKIDSYAATIILQDYLDSERQNINV